MNRQKTVRLVVVGPAGLAGLLAALVLWAGSVWSQTGDEPIADEFLERWVGVWTGEGRVDGMDVTDSLRAQWVVEDQQLRITRETTYSQDGQEHLVESVAYYRPTPDGRYQALYLDSDGRMALFDVELRNETMVTYVELPGYRGQMAWRFTALSRAEFMTYNQQPDHSMQIAGSVTYMR